MRQNRLPNTPAVIKQNTLKGLQYIFILTFLNKLNKNSTYVTSRTSSSTEIAFTLRTHTLLNEYLAFRLKIKVSYIFLNESINSSEFSNVTQIKYFLMPKNVARVSLGNIRIRGNKASEITWKYCSNKSCEKHSYSICYLTCSVNSNFNERAASAHLL